MRSNKLLWCLVLLLAVGLVAVGCGDDDDTEVTETTVIEPEDGEDDAAGEADGEAVFAQTCATCHGADGTGGTGPDLTAMDLDEDRVAEQVRNGGGAMPAYGGQLSDEEIDAVADYVADDLMQ
jgi:cytochrome c551